MNRRIAAAFGAVGALLLGPAASAAPVEPGPAAEYELESVTDGILDHGQDDGGQDDGSQGDKGQDDHDHDGDGRPDHDPEDHDEDDESKPKDDD